MLTMLSSLPMGDGLQAVARAIPLDPMTGFAGDIQRSKHGVSGIGRRNKGRLEIGNGTIAHFKRKTG